MVDFPSVPVDYTPTFVDEGGAEGSIAAEPTAPLASVPVDFNPFEGEEPEEPTEQKSVRSVPVDYDPFDKSRLNPTTSNEQEGPSTLDVATGGAYKGFVEAVQNLSQVVEQTKAKLEGRPFFTTEKAGEPVQTPADEYLEKPFSQGWSDSKWYVAQMAHMMGGLPTLMAGGAVGGLAGPAGGVAGMAGTGAVTNLIPNYQRARERGLDEDDAILETAKLFAAEFATLGIMGGAALRGFTTKVAKEVADGTVAQVIAHPIREALVQLGIIQPTIQTAGTIASARIRGQDASPDEVLTSYVTGVVGGLPFMVHPTSAALAARGLPPTPLPRQERILAPEPRIVQDFELGAPGAIIDVAPPVRLQDAIARGPTSAKPTEWADALLRERVEAPDFEIPRFLENAKGEVTKSDLLTYAEERSISVEESPRADFEGGRLSLIKEDGVPLSVADFTGRIDRDGRNTMLVENLSVPDSVGAARLLRFAADRGYERVAWIDDALGKPFDQAAAPWATEKGLTSFGLEPATGKPNLVRYVDVNPAQRTDLRGRRTLVDLTLQNPTTPPHPQEMPGLREAGRQNIKIFNRLAQRMGIAIPQWGFDYKPFMSRNGEYYPARMVIGINLARFKTAEHMFSTFAHEFGHHVMFAHFNKLSNAEKAQVIEAHARWRLGLYEKARRTGNFDPTHHQVMEERRSAPMFFYEQPYSDTRMSHLSPKQQEYWMGFDEWFAEQTARWATTSDKPLSTVDRFFSALGKALRAVVETARKQFGLPFEPTKEMKGYLDDLVKGTEIGPDQVEQMQIASLKQAIDDFDRVGAPQTPAVPVTASTANGRAILGGAGVEGREMAAHADRWRKWWDWGLNLIQISKLNPHIQPLQLYTELQKLQHLDGNNVRVQARDVLKPWQNLSRTENERLGRFIDDYMNGRFMDPAEIKKSGLRRPTPHEFSQLVLTHKLGPREVEVFHSVTKSFDNSLDLLADVLRRDAMRIPDTLKQAQALQGIDDWVIALRKKPYMPAFRFGDYTVTVYNAAGQVEHFETVETLRRQRQVQQVLEQAFPDGRVQSGFLKKDVRPLLGMPSALLDAMAQKLNLSTAQRDALKELQFEYSPAQSFRHHFQKKDLTPGYSQDWMRAYANYMYHFSNHYARTKYVDPMRDMVKQMWDLRQTRADATKLDQIRNFMSGHLDAMTVNAPKADWAALRGLMFHWYLGFSPAAAMVNLTQTPLVTMPFLGAKFGDGAAIAALSRATKNKQTYYKRATLTGMSASDPGIRALQEAIREGVIAENQAHALAGLSEGRNLLKAFGSKGEQMWHHFSEWSAFFFQTAEEFNRRVTFEAAWELGMNAPNARYVREMTQQHSLQFQRLLQKGWTPKEAAAFTVAKDAVESTQYVYAPFARPKMFQGKLGSLFMFKSFLQNTLFVMGSNPQVGGRALLMLGMMAGVAGLPFAEDIKSIIKGIGAYAFGKDWDIEDEARKAILDFAGGKIKPDLLLHGLGHYSFGIPQVVDMAGQLLGLPVPPVPNIDLSRSIGMGRVSPIDIGRLITPSKDVAASTMKELQRASGAMFGLGFSMYNFLTANPLSEPEWKKWEGILPRVMGNASTALRWGIQGEERNKLGNPVLRFDPGDGAQAGEIIAKGLGFNPTRVSEKWDNIAAKAEAVAFWDIQRELLMRQFGTAVKRQDMEGREKVRQRILEFNRSVPQGLEGKKITGDQLKQSVQTRIQTQKKQELGFPTNKRNYGIYKEIDRLYPGGSAPPGLIDAKRVR